MLLIFGFIDIKTLIKEEYRNKIGERFNFDLSYLENETELSALIQEAEAQLSLCPCCGSKQVRIRYYYRYDTRYPYRTGMAGDIIVRAHPHVVYAECAETLKSLASQITACTIRTHKYSAEDNEADFRGALRLIVETWNRRPDNN